MANSYNFRTMFNDNFKVLTWLLILFVAITPNFIFIQSARASTLGGWTITQQIAQGASLALTATKTTIINGANVLKTSTAKITPNASQVAKILRGGAAGYALSIAVEQTIGSAVDWVLDPANNQIVYKPKEDLSKPPSYCQSYYMTQMANPSITAYGCSIQEVGNNTCKKRLANSKVKDCSISNVTDTSFRIVTTCSIYDGECYGYDSQIVPQRKTNPYYDPNAQNQEKTVSLDTIAARVISNAESSTNNDHKVGAQVATTAAAEDMLANDSTTQSDVERQLNTNANTQTSEQASAESTPKDPAAPEAGSDISITFPVFCGWAPTVCEAANVVINFPTTLTNWWNTATQAISTSYAEAKQFFTDETNPETDNSEVTIHQENNIIFDDSQRFNFSSSCPTPEQFSVSFFGATQELEFSYEPLCNFMNMIKPFVIAGSYVIGAYIVMGLSRGSAE